MSRQNDVYNGESERIACGPGTVTKIPAAPGQLSVSIKLLSGGTLEIGGATGSIGSLTGLAATFGNQYPLNANEILSVNLSGAWYFWASGAATCVVAILKGKGAT